MKLLQIGAALVCLAIVSLNACKKEEFTDKETVQKHFIGRCPAKYRITTTYDALTTKIDTVIANPVDTLVFEENGTYVRRNNTIISSGNYSFDEVGENITFSGPPAVTQKLTYVRVTTIGLLVADTTTGSGSTMVRTVVEDQLAKR